MTDSAAPFPREEIEQSIPSRFERLVRRHPDRLAVKTAGHEWTYDRLNREANRVAHALLARGLAARSPVTILLDQDAPLVAALLGVLKAGMIFVVLDPSQPRSRLAQLVGEVGATSLVTATAWRDVAETLAGAARAVVEVDAPSVDPADADPGVAVGPEDLATILYTSGSTGTPKGVVTDHRVWLHNTRNYVETLGIGADDRITLLAMGTAQAVKNLCLAILTGASVFPYDVKRDGLDNLAALMRRERITMTVMGASLFRSFCDVLGDGETLPDLRVLRLGSEPVQDRDLELWRRHLSPRCLFVNGLASGETQTIRFLCVDRDAKVTGPLVPVGYPVEDKTVLLLDEQGNPVEPGGVGEIVVESRYLALGYWRSPDLTDAAFRPAQTAGGPRRYHTGDLGRLDPGGRLVCLGRKNARVKIRGHGVDLLEVDAALRALPGVKECAVATYQNRAGYAYLVGYVVPVAPPGPTNLSLREALGRTLPDFMIPSTFVVLGALPRTSSGKTDRQALPAPGRPYRDPGRTATGPRTSAETAIAAIWAEVTGHEPIDIHDHFYDLGGESLQAMRIMARVRKAFGVDVDLQSLLEAPTVAELAALVAGLQAVGGRPDSHASGVEAGGHGGHALVELQAGARRRPIFLVPGGVAGAGELFVAARLAHHVGPEFPFYGLRARSADGRVPAQPSVEEMAADYLEEIRTRQPEGPYAIVGDCAGGVVAYEIAQQLHARGQRVALLLLMDTPGPGTPEGGRRSVASYLTGLRYHGDRLRELRAGDKLRYVSERIRRVLLDLRHDLGVQSVARSYTRAILRYRPAPYPGKVTLVVSDEPRRTGPDLGWGGLAWGGIELHRVPGDHHAYIRGNVRTLAETIRGCLERAVDGT